VKPWQIVLLAVGIVLVLCCGGGALIGYRAYNGARAVDAEADHFADAFFAKFAVNYDVSTIQDQVAPEWKSQPKEIQDAFNVMFRKRLGPLKSAEPFSATNTSYKSFNGSAVTTVVVTSHATFEKAEGKVQLSLRKEDDAWKVVSMKIFSPALDGHLDEAKPTP